jgi:hypothetical protein
LQVLHQPKDFVSDSSSSSSFSTPPNAGGVPDRLLNETLATPPHGNNGSHPAELYGMPRHADAPRNVLSQGRILSASLDELEADEVCLYKCAKSVCVESIGGGGNVREARDSLSFLLFAMVCFCPVVALLSAVFVVTPCSLSLACPAPPTPPSPCLKMHSSIHMITLHRIFFLTCNALTVHKPANVHVHPFTF